MGKASNKKKTIRESMRNMPKNLEPNIPNALQNAILQPVNCHMQFRNNVPKKVLSNGQILFYLDRYVIIPAEVMTKILRAAMANGMNPRNSAIKGMIESRNVKV